MAEINAARTEPFSASALTTGDEASDRFSCCCMFEIFTTCAPTAFSLFSRRSSNHALHVKQKPLVRNESSTFSSLFTEANQSCVSRRYSPNRHSLSSTTLLPRIVPIGSVREREVPSFQIEIRSRTRMIFLRSFG